MYMRPQRTSAERKCALGSLRVTPRSSRADRDSSGPPRQPFAWRWRACSPRCRSRGRIRSAPRGGPPELPAHRVPLPDRERASPDRGWRGQASARAAGSCLPFPPSVGKFCRPSAPLDRRCLWIRSGIPIVARYLRCADGPGRPRAVIPHIRIRARCRRPRTSAPRGRGPAGCAPITAETTSKGGRRRPRRCAH